MKSLSRRTLLRGLLGGSALAIGLPTLECMLGTNGVAYADGALLPRRFGLFFWGNGILPDFWVPEAEGAGDEWVLPDMLAALAPHKDVISMVSGCTVRVPNLVPHHSGAGGILTGMPLTSSEDAANFAGPSIDQVIAQAVGGETRFRSIEFGAEPREGLSFNGVNSRNPPEKDPYSLFERIFGIGFRAPGDADAPIDPSIGLRRSVLDAVLDDANRLRDRVGSNDKSRLDQHLDGIRDLERRLARLEEDPPDLAACSTPAEPEAEYPEIDGRPQLLEKNRVMCDLMAMALACDQTRVFSNWHTYPVTNILFPGATAGHHSMTHDEPNPQPGVYSILEQITEALAYQIESLKAIPEGDGTLLDNMVLFATSDVSLGQTHSLEEFPILYAGSCCGRLQQGIHHRSVGENASKVLLSFIRAMDINAATFGSEDATASDGLSAIEV